MTIRNLKFYIARHTIKLYLRFTIRMHRKKRLSQTGSSTWPVVGLLFLLFLAIPGFTQEDWILTGTGLAVEKIRLAVPDFKASTNDAKNPDLLRSEEHTSELQSRQYLVCRLLLEKKK